MLVREAFMRTVLRTCLFLAKEPVAASSMQGEIDHDLQPNGTLTDSFFLTSREFIYNKIDLQT